jgi:hypothetical protein
MKSKGRSLLGAAGIGLRRQSHTSEDTDTPDTTDELEASDTTDLLQRTTSATKETAEAHFNLNASPSETTSITDTTDFTKPARRSRNAAAPIASGAIRMQTVYVTPDDQDRATDAAVRLKKSRQIRGQIGFSLAVRIGLRLLEEKLLEDEGSVVAIARDLVNHPGRE